MSLVTDLTEATERKDEAKIVEYLQKLLNTSKDIEIENNNIAKSLLNLNNDRITKLLLELLAEWCKIKHNRQILTDQHLIENLLQLLTREEDLILDAIRVLGNICYENEDARRIIDKKGLEAITMLLISDNERKNNLITTKASGFLVNLLNNNDDLQKYALKSGILKILENLLDKYFDSFNDNLTLFTFLLAILNSVIDYIDDQNVPFNENLCTRVIKIFKNTTTPEISVMCLEILHSQSDKDEIKTLIAENGTCELVIDLIEKYRDRVNDEESRSIMKMACDLIVIVLTGDNCMNFLYNSGKGKVYENMVLWLHSDDLDLLSTGVLAIGNFARKDSNCIQMVENGISKKLIDLLSKYNSKQSDIKVQHALLSTLKNLVIPQQNKARILDEGLIDVIYPMIQIDQFLVVFKLLGTFRMVIDGQDKAALDLLSRSDFIEKLVNWSNTSDHIGVRGEVPRLLAWLIKHCHSFKPFKYVISIKGCVKCLVEMASSNHAVMQNEAFYALNLLYIGCKNGVETNGEGCDAKILIDQLVEADIGNNLDFVVNKYGEKMDKHTIDNLLTFLEQLITSSIIVEHLKTANLTDNLAKLASNSNAQGNCEKIKNIMVQIKV